LVASASLRDFDATGAVPTGTGGGITRIVQGIVTPHSAQ
jgi:hypothetical protein